AGSCQGLGHSLRRQGRPAEALPYARRAARLTEFQNADVLVSLADAYADAGRPAEARDAAAKALEAARQRAPQLVPQIHRRLGVWRSAPGWAPPRSVRGGRRVPEFAYLNGRFVPLAEAALPLHDAGFVFGATVTDLVRTFHGRPFRLADHVERFRSSCDLCRVPQPLPDERLIAVAGELLARNAVAGQEL